GNYRGYYSKRYGRDPRLNLLDAAWFRDKDCLDVGCNTGQLSIAIARRFLTRSMTGVDIDSGLVNDAIKVRSVGFRPFDISFVRQLSNASVRWQHSGTDFKPFFTARYFHLLACGFIFVSLETCMPPEPGPPENPIHVLRKSKAALLPRALRLRAGPREEESQHERISFRTENFLAQPCHPPRDGERVEEGGDANASDPSLYDVVTMFSVVKWIHLNEGDEGVHRAFRKVYTILRAGGRFVLETQVGG
ncbi:unnamed protein product, partial [Discosporangium mesarthrocarpum]